MESFAGQHFLPGVWHFVQLLHGVLCIVGFFVVLYTALTAVDRPIEDMLSVIGIYVCGTQPASQQKLL